MIDVCGWYFVDYPTYYFITECGKKTTYKNRFKLKDKETNNYICPYCKKIIKNIKRT